MGQYLGDGCSADMIQTSSVEIAERLVGFGPGDQTYRDACWPGDTLQHQKEMERSQSACALVGGCVGRCLGDRHRLFKPPYYGRQDAFSRIQQVASDEGAWDGADSLPERGDIVMMGTDVPKDHPQRQEIIKTWGTPGHVAICTKIEIDRDKGQTIFHFVDGGRGPIKKSTRRLRCFGNQNWLADWTTRRIWGVMRVARLKLDPDQEWCIPRQLSDDNSL